MESITLQTNDSIVSSGDLLGQLQFAASAESDGGASQLVVARIYSQAEGAFSASSNPASIIFATSSSDALAASGKIKIDDNGNILPKKYFKENSYLFSQIPLIWGWASWCDRWSKFDNDLSYWNKGYKKNSSKLSNFKFFERVALFSIFRSAASINVKNFWDYQFFSTMIKEKSLCIIPKNNLIQNIGWGESATHTKKENFRSFVEVEEVNTIIHPEKILSEINIDNYISYKIHHGVSKLILESNFLFLYRISYLFRRGTYKLEVLFQYFKSKILN